MIGDILRVLGTDLAVVLVAAVLLWLISVRMSDPSFVDACWGLGFVVVAIVSFLITDGEGVRRSLLLALPVVWGLRLGLSLLWRWRREGPDRRYQSMLRRAPGNPHLFTLQKVFGLQAVLLWLVSWPIQIGQAAPARTESVALWVGVVLAVVGIAFESIGDLQLVRFRADPRNKGKVLDRGLWRYTRHPNYFGDTCFWWGVGLVAIGHPITLIALVGPAAMTYLLLKWSGVVVLERHLHRAKPAYAAYAARTSAFVPRPPRPSAG